MTQDIELIRHKEWLGFLQPVGLVVSPPALVKFQCVPNRNIVELQQTFQTILTTKSEDCQALISDFPALVTEVLGWEPDDLVAEIAPKFTVPLPEYSEILEPTYIVPDPDTNFPSLLIQIIENRPLDELDSQADKTGRWNATPQAKFERLLRETNVNVGLLCNGSLLRLVYAPRGESSGYLTFPVAAMGEVAGRPILSAMIMLLGSDRLFVVSTERRLPALLHESRKYQSEVSIKLAEQVLDALWELLRGFQTADEASNGKLFSEIAITQPEHIYGGLITTLMRLVFLLYAEDEGLMPPDAVYTQNYAVTGLYEKLQFDAGNYPDTMDQRYGAWAWLLSLFQLVYDGGGHLPNYLPARNGQLFDPKEYPFLRGRTQEEIVNKEGSDLHLKEVPRIADGVIFRVLNKLLILEGERLSYRALDVEQIGSVYEAVMGYEVERAESFSIGVWSKPQGSKSSVTVVVSVDEILKNKANDRAKYLKEVAGCEVSGNSLKQLKEGKTADDIVAALGRKVSRQTPTLMPVGSLYLQPGEERRRSGSHYTPRAMTEPIVRETLRPILAGLGENATPEQILELKVCDLAMGSGAFLVESCRQLAEKLVDVWNQQNCLPEIPLDEYPLLYARRLVAGRCLYGVDKNPFAANLAKLSLWLVTLAKEHPFTFLDHALKCGDSLVGLSYENIKDFNWIPQKTEAEYGPLFAENIAKDISQSKFYRDEIIGLGDAGEQRKIASYQKAEQVLKNPRLTGDLVISCFFAEDKDKARKERRDALRLKADVWQKKGLFDDSELIGISRDLRMRNKPIVPFNWEVEFPEVFDRKNPGFDVIVGNPPFAGKNTAINANPLGYLDWLKVIHPEAHGNADLVSHFFRRGFTILRNSGCLGLIATNTISQGDTRSTGLRFICENGGMIYNATRRFKWPGLAAVVVSVVHVQKVGRVATKNIDLSRKSLAVMQPKLDGKVVSKISAFLFHAGGNADPEVLLANANKSFQGSIVLGMGFTFDDSNSEATTIAEMQRLIAENPINQECIFPYIGGEEVNSSPTHSHRRYVINFGEMSEAEAGKYPDLMRILEEKVKPERDVQKRNALRVRWWQYAEKRPGLVKAIANCDRVLVSAQTSKYRMFTFLPKGYVYDQKLVIFPLDSLSAFATLHSRVHEIWVLFMGSSMKDDPVYTPTDCFETFPFPSNWETNAQLEEIGKTYYEYRAELMLRNNQGLTETYNRFHNPEERHPDIMKLRQLHGEMDRIVLDAYGWKDIATDCNFLLDYEEEEEEDPPQTPLKKGGVRQKKKPWRYRWPEEVHDEVLARLLELNLQRSQEEILGGKAAEGRAKGGKKTAAKSRKKVADSPSIPGFSDSL
ncbi:class I SAM-dependent DNA methyltransferase [Lyngbya sp. CCAP 1446/10]|uniref:Eco57I restriction-modification methylase domain-containing protein n=1 Tax=Lyngbya sp. CCAP 1446/10 TaxID=439293 RepID=UPI002238516F|nr:DNA methyltransferase [Lyngbya sp. CCAP 1446/10]MCW6053056.1 class I SAM-dependent DNA methyltransferase [Lyngbya sp. CCAP 1446/10]